MEPAADPERRVPAVLPDELVQQRLLGELAPDPLVER
jgi:hypothetical protein